MKSGDNITIKDGCNNLFIKRFGAVDFLLQKFNSMTCRCEALMSTDSTSIGGVYQTLNFDSVKELFFEVNLALENLQLDYPRLAKSQIVVADLGCGQNAPMILGNVLFGWRTIGFEIDRNRLFLAASSFLNLKKSLWFSNLDVALYEQDLSSVWNYEGIHAYLLWDRAFVDDVTYAIYKNIHRSMSENDVVLIQSCSHPHRFEVLNKFFHVTEVSEVCITFRDGNARDRLKIFCLSRCITQYTAPPVGPSAVEKAALEFYMDKTTISYENLEKRMVHEMASPRLCRKF